jgi:hypothetical protein
MSTRPDIVPADGTAIVRDTLGCLRLITCTENTQRLTMNGVPMDAYTAWQVARHDIFSEWSLATDPANLQPKVRPALKADHLRKYPPPDLNQDEINGLIESIEAPWGTRIEKQIREAAEPAQATATSEAIVEVVRKLGLEPFRAPEPLPPIEESEVRLVCWMTIQP